MRVLKFPAPLVIVAVAMLSFTSKASYDSLVKLHTMGMGLQKTIIDALILSIVMSLVSFVVIRAAHPKNDP